MNKNQKNVPTAQSEARPRTYTVAGMVDYEALIPVGGATLRVPFTGGSVTGWGFAPARFTTSNPALQRIIESSEGYLSGRIHLASPNR